MFVHKNVVEDFLHIDRLSVLDCFLLANDKISVLKYSIVQINT